MTLHRLPTRTGGAAQNMAADFLLLQRYPDRSAPRFRHYGWRAAAYTFGYAQKIAWVREQLPPGERVDLCRRPTGGGMVDHREDWTYALVIPRGHPLEELRASDSYRAVHEALAVALRAQGVNAELKPANSLESEAPAAATGAPSDAAAKDGVCFERAEISDVVERRSGRKIAGAAQKRNKRGLLLQGSVWRPAVSGDALDWDRFELDFVTGIARALGAEMQDVPWPEFEEEEVVGLTEQYSAPEWIEYR